MDGTGFLRTVRVGGFDKKDVLAYVDDLNTKIYTLEAELEEKKTLLEGATEGGGGSVDTSKYDELLAADKAKIAELQTANSSLKNQLKILEDDMAAVTKESDALKQQNKALEDELQEAKNKLAAGGGAATNDAMDLSNVFIEAQKTATTIVTQAKESARKMDDDAKKLANQVVDDANGKASSIVRTAEDKAGKILNEAENSTAEMRAAANQIRSVIASEIHDIETNVYKLNEVLQMFSNDSLSKLAETKGIIESAKGSLANGEIPVVAGAKPVARPAPAPVHAAPKPAPAPPPAPTPVATPVAAAPVAAAPVAAAPEPKAEPKVQAAAPPPPPPPPPPPAAKPAPKFGFDMSELESLTKAAEAAEANGG